MPDVELHLSDQHYSPLVMKSLCSGKGCLWLLVSSLLTRPLAMMQASPAADEAQSKDAAEKTGKKEILEV